MNRAALAGVERAYDVRGTGEPVVWSMPASALMFSRPYWRSPPLPTGRACSATIRLKPMLLTRARDGAGAVYYRTLKCIL
jgi:hypothetical protein